MKSEFEYDVFLSYSSKDKGKVHDLAERLKQDGLRVWLEAWAIRPGDSIPLKIQQGLEQSRVLLMCMSPAYFASDWGRMEHLTLLFRDPTNAERRFIPILIAECHPPDIIAQFARIDWREAVKEAYAEMLAACRDVKPENIQAKVKPPTSILARELPDNMKEQGRIDQGSRGEDQLKYERLCKEMDNLIGPLFSRTGDSTVQYFTKVYHSDEGSSIMQGIFAFWRDIKKNIYLAPRSLRESLEYYSDAREKYRTTYVNRATRSEERTASQEIFDNALEDLLPKIRYRYNELSDQLEECERRLNIN